MPNAMPLFLFLILFLILISPPLPPPQGGACGEEGEKPSSAGRDAPAKTDAPSKGHPEWTAFLSCWELWPVKQG